MPPGRWQGDELRGQRLGGCGHGLAVPGKVSRVRHEGESARLKIKKASDTDRAEQVIARHSRCPGPRGRRRCVSSFCRKDRAGDSLHFLLQASGKEEPENETG